MSVRDRPDDDVASTGHPIATSDSVIASVLDVRIKFTPTLPVVRLTGELDLDSAHLLVDALDAIAATSCPADLVVLDLAGVTFCDVAGLRAIETSAAILAAADQHLVLYRPPRRVTRLIAMTGIASGLARHQA